METLVEALEKVPAGESMQLLGDFTQAVFC